MLNTQQIYALLLFFGGSFVLTVCNRLEHKMDEKLRDPKLRWKVLDGASDGLIRKKNIVGTILSLLGGAMALAGLALFFLNVR